MKRIITVTLILTVVSLMVMALASCELFQPEPTEPSCLHEWKDATCEAPKNCMLCGATEGEALGHDIVVDEAVASTCTAEGLTEGEHCSRCDHKVAQEKVAMLPHTEVVDAAVDATCTAPGKTEGKHCSACDTVIVAQEDVAQLLHELAYVTTLPTADAKGHTVGTCNVCSTEVIYDDVSIMGAGTYTLEASALSGIKQYSLADGEVKVVEGVFECHLSNKYRTDDGQKKTFPDDYFGTSRMNFGGKTEINSEKNPDMIKNGIVITTTGETTITIWWVEGGDDHRQIALYGMDGQIIAQTNEQSLAKNDPCVSTLTVPAGTYIIGNAINTNYIFKLVVEVAE